MEESEQCPDEHKTPDIRQSKVQNDIAMKDMTEAGVRDASLQSPGIASSNVFFCNNEK